MPLSQLKWVHRTRLFSNSYNPNKVAPPELKLLKQSIREDGWTQPIVVQPADDEGNHEIIDGFHRWTVSGHEDIYNLTNGFVPVVTTRGFDPAHQRMSTIRHNRARGAHNVLNMSDIVNDLLDSGQDTDSLATRLGMHREEVERFQSRGDIGKRLIEEEKQRGRPHHLSEAWVPVVPEEGDKDADSTEEPYAESE